MQSNLTERLLPALAAVITLPVLFLCALRLTSGSRGRRLVPGPTALPVS